MTARTDLVTLGETMGLIVNEQPGRLALQRTVSLSSGGAESNVAIGLARLGYRTAWVGRVGADPIGDRIIRDLRGEGVDVHAVIDAHARTGMMVKERRMTGHSRVTYYRDDSAGSRLAPDDVPVELVGAAAVLHVTGITPSLSVEAERAVHTAIDIAERAGTTVSFDVNHRSALGGHRDAAEIYRQVAVRADIVFAGADEALLLAEDQEIVDPLEALAATGAAQVVLKRGADGASAIIDGSRFDEAAVTVPVVDTVGAGDAFVSGYLAALIAEETPQRRLQLACLSGAFACMNSGDWEGAPTMADLALLLDDDPVAR